MTFTQVFDRYFNEEYSLDCDTIWLIQNSLTAVLKVFFQFDFSSLFSSNVSGLGRLYFISIFFTAMNQL